MKGPATRETLTPAVLKDRYPYHNMNAKIDIPRDAVLDSLRSGHRQSMAHSAFSTEMVKLAFGKDRKGRIVHIATVNRGLECGCACPACSESLVAKQGDKKAWHFAHASGGACRDALSAGFAGFLAQLLTDGHAISLPDLEWTWGASLATRSLPPFQFESARAASIGPQGGFGVRARAPGASRDVMIVFRAVRGARPVMASEEYSLLEIDLLTVLEQRFAAGQDGPLDESWVASMMLNKAPRHWISNLAAGDAREKLKRQRLGMHLDALQEVEEASALPLDDRLSEDVEDIELIGLQGLLDLPEIEGERFLRPGWRAALLRDLVVRHLFEGGKASALEAGFNERDIVRLIARRQLVLAPELMRPLEADDAIEMEAHAPDLRRPIEIIKDYLRDLWSADILRARPGYADNEGEGKVDPRLASALGRNAPDWIAGPGLTELIQAHASHRSR